MQVKRGAPSAGQRTERLATDGDLGAVSLVDDAINLLDVVGVGDDLVVGDNVLGTQLAYRGRGAAAAG
jgi:hypothetical protein